MFDFDKIIPMPESLNIEAGSTTDEAIAYYVTERLTIPIEQTNLSELISNNFSDNWAHKVVSRITPWAKNASDEDKDKMYLLGKQYMLNKENYGFFHWYDWRIENWGTKWNSEDVCLDGNTFGFETAWSPCSPVILALAKRFPEAAFRYVYDESGMGFCGAEEYRNGKLVYSLEADFHETYLEDDSESDEENPPFIDGDILPVSGQPIDVKFIPTGTDGEWTVGQIYYREQVDDEFGRQLKGEVRFIGEQPTTWFY